MFVSKYLVNGLRWVTDLEYSLEEHISSFKMDFFNVNNPAMSLRPLDQSLKSM